MKCTNCIKKITIKKITCEDCGEIVEELKPVWKTIKLGTHKTVKELENAVRKENTISGYALELLEKTELALKEKDIDLIKITVKELGFKESACLKDIYAKAKELGLELCPAEVGPQLRLQYQDQPNGEWLRIAMEPTTDSSGYLDVFKVGRHDDGSWLYWDFGHPDYVWDGDSTFVFTRRK